MTETEFLEAATSVFERIEQAIEDSDTDYSIIEGVLELELENGSKIIVSRHLPNREIWLAARSGGFHYRFDGTHWQDTRGGTEFFSKLSSCITDQGGEAVTF